MSSHDTTVSIEDIRINLGLVLEFTKGISFQSFIDDIQLQYAVI